MHDKHISLCLTTYNRFEFTIESFAQVINDGRISEIIISDDASTDGSIQKLIEHFKYHPKVKIFANLINVGVYQNKKRSVELATNNWCIVFDSDNVISESYIDTIFNIITWYKDRFYCPDYAAPAIDYTHFAGETITKENAGKYIDQRNGASLFNTMNFFCNRERYLEIFKPDEDPIAADSILINYLNLINGGSMYIVPKLEYGHRIHSGSHYVNFTHKSDIYHKQITDKIRLMK